MSHIVQFKAREIGLDEESTVTIAAHPGEKGINLANELNQRLGPIILDIMSAAQVENTEQLKDARENALAQAVKKLYDVWPNGDLLPMAKKVLAHTTVTRREDTDQKVYKLSEAVDFSGYFQRNYKALIPLMRKVIEVNGFLELDISGLVLETGEQQTES